MHPITALMSALGVLTVVFVAGWARAVQAVRSVGGPEPSPSADARVPSATQILLGAVTNFFDFFGIGSFATTTGAFKLLNMVPDRIIPGTLNVGHTLPTVAQALISFSFIPVDITTLVLMIVAAVAGAWLGAGVVAHWSKRKVQLGMGSALLAAAVFMFMRQMGLFPHGSDAIGVTGVKLAIAVVGNFALGALMTLGIGLYAPCMILVSLLGMSERTAFPIMMGSCAFLMPVGSLRFIREQSYSLRPALGLALGGIPAVLVAGFIIRIMDPYYVRWVVIVVVLYTAIMMLLSAARSEDAEVAPRPGKVRH